jgi:hypothetical protein
MIERLAERQDAHLFSHVADETGKQAAEKIAAACIDKKPAGPTQISWKAFEYITYELREDGRVLLSQDSDAPPRQVRVPDWPWIVVAGEVVVPREWKGRNYDRECYEERLRRGEDPCQIKRATNQTVSQNSDLEEPAWEKVPSVEFAPEIHKIVSVTEETFKILDTTPYCGNRPVINGKVSEALRATQVGNTVFIPQESE